MATGVGLGLHLPAAGRHPGRRPVITVIADAFPPATAPRPPAPVDVRPLLQPLGDELLALLRGLAPADWDRPATSRWSVKDVAAHLLDTALRRLTFHRDGAPLPPPPAPIAGYADLATLLHRLNADWVAASDRMSPRVLVDLLAVVDPQGADFLATLDPDGRAFFAVAWAGEDESRHWLDVGREYTERWHHQQQIRDAVGAPKLVAERWLRPALEVAARCLPRAWAPVRSPAGTAVHVAVTGPSGGDWTLLAGDTGWQLLAGRPADPAAAVAIDEETAWRLWHRMLDPRDARARWRTQGDARLVAPLLASVAVMA